MRYKLLGKSGLRVSELCLGTMTFGTSWGWGADKEESQKQLDAFTAVGGNFIDTSVNYTDGESETILGDLLKDKRDQYVVATKYTLTQPTNPDPNSGGNSRKNMMQSVKRSLQRLQTDYIDILYLHMWDYMTPVEEVMRGLDDLVRSGKVHYVAVSDTPAWVVSQCNMMAELRGWSRFIGLQVPYSLGKRDVEQTLLPMAKQSDMGVLAFSMLRGGILTGKYSSDSNEPTRIDKDQALTRLSEQNKAAIEEIGKISDEVGRSMAQVAINWVRQQQHRAQIIPLLGARTASQLEDNLAVLQWELDEGQLQRLDEVSATEWLYPHDYKGNPYVYGSTLDLIDNHRKYDSI
jgi:aryl-alcohol dehydrogenase-like predicted oxidoreductase